MCEMIFFNAGNNFGFDFILFFILVLLEISQIGFKLRLMKKAKLNETGEK